MNERRGLYCIHGQNNLDYSNSWVMLTRGIGRDPNDRSGENFRLFENEPIVRLNNGYGSAGTIPQPRYYEPFAQRCANFVEMSPGCTRWIIGNEPNHSNERPDGQPITPSDYARCYNLCRAAIHALPGHEQDEVLVAPIAPWNPETTYDGNANGDWIQYFEDVQRRISGCDGFALHAYARWQHPDAITATDKMGPPFEHYHNGYQVYTDWMFSIQSAFQGLPCYITEFDCLEPWADANTGVIQRAYQEIYTWNDLHPNRPILCLAVYRWEYDKWIIKDKPRVIADFMEAVACGYTYPDWEDTEPPVVEPEPPDPEPPTPACAFEPVDYERVEAIVRRAVRDELARWVWAPVEMPDVE